MIKEEIRKETEKPVVVDKSIRRGIGLGIQTGALMGLYLIGLDALNLMDNIALKFAKYLVLIAFLGFALKNLKDALPKGELFRNGMQLGAYLTVAAGLSLFAINLFAFLISPELVFEKFNLNPDGLGDTLVIGVAVFFETLVAGLVSTFIWLQFYKSRKDY